MILSFNLIYERIYFQNQYSARKYCKKNMRIQFKLCITMINNECIPGIRHEIVTKILINWNECWFCMKYWIEWNSLQFGILPNTFAFYSYLLNKGFVDIVYAYLYKYPNQHSYMCHFNAYIYVFFSLHFVCILRNHWIWNLIRRNFIKCIIYTNSWHVTH